jgi:hypothetical protein
VSDKEINAIAVAATPNIGLYAVIIALAIFAPRVAVFGYLVVAIVGLFRLRGDRLPTRTTVCVTAPWSGLFLPAVMSCRSRRDRWPCARFIRAHGAQGRRALKLRGCPKERKTALRL